MQACYQIRRKTMAEKDVVLELVKKIATIDNELDELKESRKDILKEYKNKLDLSAFKSALRIIKIHNKVDVDELDSIVEIIENS